MVDWLSPVSALIGAAIGAGSTILAQRGQWRRELEQRDRDTRRQLYAAYLAAHHQSGEALWALANGIVNPDHENYLQAAHRAFNSESLYPLRAEIVVFGSKAVADATQEALATLRQLRDCIGQKNLAGSKAYLQAHTSARAKQKNMRSLMRSDLGLDRGAVHHVVAPSELEETSHL